MLRLKSTVSLLGSIVIALICIAAFLLGIVLAVYADGPVNGDEVPAPAPPTSPLPTPSRPPFFADPDDPAWPVPNLPDWPWFPPELP